METNIVHSYYMGYDDQLLNKNPASWFKTEKEKIAYFLGWNDAENNEVALSDENIIDRVQKIC